jgi:hypothetical protein
MQNICLKIYCDECTWESGVWDNIKVGLNYILSEDMD